MAVNENCREKITSNDYLDIIIDFPLDFTAYALPSIDYCYLPIEQELGILYVERARSAPLSVSLYRYAYIPKCYGLADGGERSMRAQQRETSLLRTRAEGGGRLMTAQLEETPLAGAYEATGILQLQRPPLELTGRDILIGFIDTGIRYTLDAFRNSDGTSKVLSIWDQTDQSGTPPSGLLYGSEYTNEMLNEDLIRRDNGETEGLLPHVDVSGHGTRTAFVAVNAAPNAQLIVVKCQQAKPYLKNYYAILQEAEAYAETDIMTALKYLEDVSSRVNKPIVICITMGTNMGDHASHSLLDYYMYRLANRKEHCIVIGGGNEGNSAHHFEGAIDTQSSTPYEDIELRVSENTSGFIMELWGSIPSIYTISIRSPDGEMIQRIPARYGRSQKFSFVYSNSRVTVDYVLVEMNSGEELIFLRFDTPLQGIWTIRVYAEGNFGIATFHMWLPINDFLRTPVYFLEPNPYTTLTEPAYLENAISLSYYDYRNNSFAIDSGRGYQRLGLITPDLSVPGIEVQTALGLSSGSSIAAGLMAGAAAQFMQWAIVQEKDSLVNSKGVRNYFIRGARRDEGVEYPNRTWGDCVKLVLG